MNLYRMLAARADAGRPVRVGLIGAGKFGLMFLSQVRRTDGMHLVGVADLNTARARSQLKLGCWPEEQYAATSIDDALKHGGTVVTEIAAVVHGQLKPPLRVLGPAEITVRGAKRRRGASHPVDVGEHLELP